ncbi:HAMP domain-containing histidine kinase [Antarcticibacterium flavum]|uniref:histidine kinase n=1 Tax=Antarcticibacterium flavum TaxID=2058175 RepID=A0A5B7X6G9_9FLAO|nr:MULTISPECIES: HAMP domain-containing sensor histidine kinase [Antarcticibacterium]MCM4160891.1 two-component sensor histidine kinase [Antarcticibacterium sp. W02-3]QCY71114.1 HAMP domain-containing histidine kinase [Antarcticibacterium flavum]
MKRRKIYIILFIIAVVGLFVVQYQYLRIGLNLAELQFQQKIERAGSNLKKDLDNENQLSFLLGQSIGSGTYFSLSADSLQDASNYFLNEIVKDRLLANKITANFSYNLYSQDRSIDLRSPVNFSAGDSLIKYPIELEGYLPETLGKEMVLELQFKDLNAYYFSQLHGLFIPGLLFLAIVIFVVIWMLRLFYWQRNLITITNDFINNLTHELKTPVFSIGVATKILEKDLDEDQKRIVFHIRKQVDRLNVHIDQVLELASLETKRKFIDFKIIDIKPELTRWCNDFIMLSKLENFSFQYDMEPGEYYIKVAPFHFENVVNNLLDNAKKYSDNPEITLRAYTLKRNLHICIKDNGKGISEKEKQRIFKKFYRVTEGDLHAVKGYGLGLNYVQEVIKRHKGRIKLESELHQGTEITLIIPLKNAR